MGQPIRTRRQEGGVRRVVAAGQSGGATTLDDRVCELALSRDGKRILVAIPHELQILDIRDLTLQRSVELKNARPSVGEDLEGVLWIGGAHLYRGTQHGTQVGKVGARLGGFVDRLVVLRPGLLCGVGSAGEVLLDTSGADEPVELHRRKAAERTVRQIQGVVALPDERAVFADGGPQVWLLDPAHPNGYGQLRFRQTSSQPVRSEGITALAVARGGRVVLGARDGGVCWTLPDLRIAEERFPVVSSAESRPLAILSDRRFIYVLRPRGVLHRFLIEPLEPVRGGRDVGAARGQRQIGGPRDQGRRPASRDDEPVAPAQQCRLTRSAEVMALLQERNDYHSDERASDDSTRILLGSSQADGLLGMLWEEDVEKLSWTPLPLRARSLTEHFEEPAASTPFQATRNKVSGGPSLSSLSVDTVLASVNAGWLLGAGASLLERPLRAVRELTALSNPDAVAAGDRAEAEGEADSLGSLMPADTLVLPLMLRMREGTARPGLLVWPGSAQEESDPPPVILLAWGDDPKGWMVLDTPSIRAQRWSRRDLFPMTVALAATPPTAPGSRVALPTRWIDPEGFVALGRELKKSLKVSW